MGYIFSEQMQTSSFFLFKIHPINFTIKILPDKVSLQINQINSLASLATLHHHRYTFARSSFHIIIKYVNEYLCKTNDNIKKKKKQKQRKKSITQILLLYSFSADYRRLDVILRPAKMSSDYWISHFSSLFNRY